jgi:hypothetical protein
METGTAAAEQATRRLRTTADAIREFNTKLLAIAHSACCEWVSPTHALVGQLLFGTFSLGQTDRRASGSGRSSSQAIDPASRVVSA